MPVGMPTLATWSIFETLARNWALAAMLTTTLILVVIPVLVLNKYVRISLNIMRTTKPPLSRSPLDFDRPAGEPVSFPAFDGVRLSGMLLAGAPHVPRRGLVVFAHEYCSDMYSCGRYTRSLLDAGFDVFTFDFRGHGQSDCDSSYTPRQWVTDREVADMRGAVAYVRQMLEQRGEPPQFGLFGISRGAGAALIVAAENRDIACVVSDGAFSTDRVIEWYMRRWAYIFATVRILYENHHPRFWKFLRWVMVSFAAREFRCQFPSVYKTVKRLRPMPLLFIHGEKDSYLPVEQSRTLYALAPQPKALWIAAGARHNQAVILHPELYARLTIDFFTEHLASGTLPPAAASPARDPVAAPTAAGAQH